MPPAITKPNKTRNAANEAMSTGAVNQRNKAGWPHSARVCLVAVTGSEGNCDAESAGQVHFEKNLQRMGLVHRVLNGGTFIDHGPFQRLADPAGGGDRGRELVLHPR